MKLVNKIKKELKILSDRDKAKVLQGFFKTGKGEYGEGDIFIGVTVPLIRKISKEYYQKISLDEIQELLMSKIHEERLWAVITLVYKYEKVITKKDKTSIYKFYIKNFKYINNWDLVDLSAPKITGKYMIEFPEKRIILEKWAKSKNLWIRRISIVSTFQFIYNNESIWTLKIAEILLNDEEDLIHKAVGWMLRELGKRVHQKVEEEFLKKYYKKMPRMMLRYAIERFDKKKKAFYMKK